MIQFIDKQKIIDIANSCGKNTCGSVSLCSILEYWQFVYDHNSIVEISRDGKKTDKYPKEGSNILGLLLSASTIKDINVTFHCNWDMAEIEQNCTESYEKQILEELKSKSAIEVLKPMDLATILENISDSKIPILPHCSNGIGHFSPLLGKSENKLEFAFNSNLQRFNVEVNEFEKKMWNNYKRMNSCIWIEKKK